LARVARGRGRAGAPDAPSPQPHTERPALAPISKPPGSENPRSVTRGVSRVELDGAPLAAGAAIALADDGATHWVHVVLG